MQPNDFLIDQLAQENTSLYEQFLAANQAVVLRLKQSGTDISPHVLERAESDFNNSARNVYSWMLDNISRYVPDGLIPKLSSDEYDTWIKNAELGFTEGLNRSIAANRSTFLSAMRFGGAFGGLSHLLENMHGSMGFLVQKKAQEMQWNVRLSDGRTIRSTKLVYLLSHRYLNCMMAANTLKLAQESDLDVVLYDKNGQVIVLEEGDPTILLNDVEIVDKYFHFNSRNYFAFQPKHDMRDHQE